MLFYSLLYELDEEGQECVHRIFEQYKNLIYKIAYQILRKPQDAEDTLDEVMINVIRNIDHFQNAEPDAVIAQLVVYSRNAAINQYRKNRRRNKRITALTYENEEDTTDIEYPDPDQNVEEIILSKETAEIVRKHIIKLPIQMQEAIELVYGFGYSNVEAARVLHITPNAVTLRLFKARKRLMKKIGGELNEHI